MPLERKIDATDIEPLIEEGWSAHKISKMLGVSPTTIYRNIKEYGLEYEPRIKPQLDVAEKKLLAVLGKDTTIEEKARELGCSSATVAKYMKQHGIEQRSKRRKRLEFDPALLQKMIDSGMSAYRMADELGCSYNVIYGLIKRYGLVYPKG